MKPRSRKAKEIEWRVVPSNATYEVSEFGDVRRAIAGRTRKKGHVLKGTANKLGYVRFKVMRPGGGKALIFAHRWVVEAFIGCAPTNKHQVAHNDGNPSNNHFSNLRWATCRENLADRARHGTELRGERNGRARLTADQVLEIRREFKSRRRFGAISALAREYDMSIGAIFSIVHEYNWTHLNSKAAQ